MQYIISALILFTGFAQAEFIELQTKQAIDNLRYITSDGKITYYQTKSGDFSLSTNYKNYPLIKSKKLTHYQTKSSLAKKKILISMDSDFFSYNNFNEYHDIYISDIGSKNVKKIAKGIPLNLHLDDDYVSIYKSKQNQIHFQELKSKRRIKIKLFNKVSPYFRPDTAMISEQDVIYNDINEKGEAAVLSYSNIEKKITPIFKSKIANSSLSFCYVDKNIIVLEKSNDSSSQVTNIYFINAFNNEAYKKKDLIYSSTYNDIGNLICTNKDIYFIKTISYNSKINSKKTELAKINIKSKNLKVLKSDINPTQVIVMDDLVLVPKNGKIYLAEGSANKLINDKIEKTKP